MTTFYGHSMNDAGQRQGLLDHINAVTELAAGFAAAFGAEELARYAGLWHDIGKFNPAFQEYLLACERNPEVHGHGPDHKAAGTLLAKSACAAFSATGTGSPRRAEEQERSTGLARGAKGRSCRNRSHTTSGVGIKGSATQGVAAIAEAGPDWTGGRSLSADAVLGAG